jgi:hypothetical protein
MNVQWRKSTNEREGKPEQKFDGFGTIFRNSKCFKKSMQKLYIYFLLNRQAKHLKTICV